MKKNKLLFILAVAMCLLCLSFCLLACGSDEKDDSPGTGSDITEGQPMEEQKIARTVVLLGQSNMEGTSYKTLLRDKGVSKTKYEEYLAGYSGVKISYCVPWNPAQSSRNCFLPTALGMGGQDNRFGPEVGIAEYLSEKGYENVFMVKYSFGGTALRKEWRSPSSGGNVGSLYTGAVKYVLNAMKVLEDMGYYPVIDAICWMQGESDADVTQDVAQAYLELQKNFMSDLRNEFAFYGHTGGIGFVDAGISSYWRYNKIVNDAKYEISQMDELNAYFSTIDEKLEYMNEPSYNADPAHYDCLSEIKLGHLFGQNLEFFLNRKIQVL